MTSDKNLQNKHLYQSMNKSLPITFAIQKSLPIIQSIFAKIEKSSLKNPNPIKLELLIKSLPNETIAINQIVTD